MKESHGHFHISADSLIIKNQNSQKMFSLNNNLALFILIAQFSFLFGQAFNCQNNKWNPKEHGRNLVISNDGLGVNYSGQGKEYNLVRTIIPVPILIPMPNVVDKNASIASYFEVKIVKKPKLVPNIHLGFTDQQLKLEGDRLGKMNNSIGIWWKGGMSIDGTFINFRGIQFFAEGDVVGLGLIRSSSSLQCFATCNGQLLGKADLPSKFLYLTLFPAVGLSHNGDSIRANFGKEEWRFNPFQMLVKQ